MFVTTVPSNEVKAITGKDADAQTATQLGMKGIAGGFANALIVDASAMKGIAGNAMPVQSVDKREIALIRHAPDALRVREKVREKEHAPVTGNPSESTGEFL